MPHTKNKPLAGRVALVTGANTGIGRVTARELAKQGAHVFVACRSADRAQAVIDEVRAIPGSGPIEFLPLDLADLQSVRQCARLFLARHLPLHLLVNNAGLAGLKGVTNDGFEMAFGVNHLGPFLLTQLLLDCLKTSAPARIVNVASRAHVRATGIDWAAQQQASVSKGGVREYCVSKLANVLFSAELGRRLQGSGVTTYSLHPGVVASEVWRQVPWPFGPLMKLGMISTERGAQTSLYCATSPAVAQETGLYYDKCQSVKPSRVGRDAALAAELWAKSEQWVGGGAAQRQP